MKRLRANRGGERREELREVGALSGRRLIPGSLGLCVIIGIVAGFALMTQRSEQAVVPANAGNRLLSDVDRLTPTELESLILKALSTLQKNRDAASIRGATSQNSRPDQVPVDSQQVQLAISNVRRLLPIAQRLTLESLREAHVGDALKSSGLLKEERLINGVNRIALDPRLNDSAQVRENRLSEIRIGFEYASYLVSDDEAMFLLAHELTHVAARSGRLGKFIENVNENARSVGVRTTDDQREDLACELTAARVLKRFISHNPTEEPNSTRFSRVFGYASTSEKLALMWAYLCATEYDNSSDKNHLSQQETVKALVGIDPSLKDLLREDSTSSYCR